MFGSRRKRNLLSTGVQTLPKNEGFEREGSENYYSAEMAYVERVRRSEGGGEEGQVALLEARYIIFLKMLRNTGFFDGLGILALCAILVLRATKALALTSGSSGQFGPARAF